jgi:hypothetical protein
VGTNLKILIDVAAVGQNLCQRFCTQNIPEMYGRQEFGGFRVVLDVSDGNDSVVDPIEDYGVDVNSNRVFG